MGFDPLQTSKNLDKLANKIESLPHDYKLEMSEYASSDKIGTTKNLCNTVACVAGWATTVFPDKLILKNQEVVLKRNFEIYGVQAFASVLGITDDQSENITQKWPCGTHRQIRRAKIKELRSLSGFYKKLAATKLKFPRPVSEKVGELIFQFNEPGTYKIFTDGLDDDKLMEIIENNSEIMEIVSTDDYDLLVLFKTELKTISL